MKLRYWLLICALIVAAPPVLSQDVRNTYIGIAAQVADGILTNAKLANMTNSTTKCRTTAGTGVPEDCTPDQLAAIVGNTAWTAYTPTVTCAVGAQGGVTALGFYKVVGKIVFTSVDVTINTISTCAGIYVAFSTPVAVKSTSTLVGYSANGFDTTLLAALGTSVSVSSNTIRVFTTPAARQYLASAVYEAN